MRTKIYITCRLFSAIVASMLFASPATVGQVAEPGDPHHEDVRVRYARANLRLAEIELQIAQTGNENIAGMYSKRTIQLLRNNVAYAKARMRYETGQEDELHAVHLQAVQSEAEMAESNLDAALAANKRLPGSFTALEIERFRAVAEVARLAVEKARDPAVTQNPLDHLQWQLDRLRSEISHLDILMDKILSGS